MATIYLDIETLPCDDESQLAEVIAKVYPPRTLKKQETIDAWWKDEGEQAKQEAIAKTALDGTYGRICCIGWAIDDQPAQSHIGIESACLEAFYSDCKSASIAEHYGKPVLTHKVVGHNITGFDLRFLWQRSVINRIQRPKSIPWKAKPWDDSIADTMLMWNQDRDKRISLDRLCKVLGVDTPKTDLDGSKIAQAWADERFDDIAAYCRGDVEATRKCYLRML